MAEATTNTTTIIARADQHDIDLHKASDRVNFGSIREPIDVPYLLGVQTDSFDWLIGNERWQKRVQEDLENGTNTVPHTSGLDEVFQEISPIENFAQTMSLTFSDPYFEEPRHTVQECKEKDYTYSAPLYVNAEFEKHRRHIPSRGAWLEFEIDKRDGDTQAVRNQVPDRVRVRWAISQDPPADRPRHGTFIIGGTERVIVSQLVTLHAGVPQQPATAPGRRRTSDRSGRNQCAPPIRKSSARRSSRAVAHGSSSRSTSATSSACAWTVSASSPPSCPSGRGHRHDQG